MSTVFVFGAGASYHAGYPLASAMGEPLLSAMLQSGAVSYVAYAQYLIDHFGMPSNIEDWITAIESRQAALKDVAGTLRQEFGLARAWPRNDRAIVSSPCRTVRAIHHLQIFLTVCPGGRASRNPRAVRFSEG